jgi:CheY-like chemotaxis protein
METIKPKVLVIDDDPANADTLAMVLNISGFEATAVHSAERALELAQQAPFDHLITDVVMNGMNGMNGIDAAIAIRQVLPDCRILLISGNNDTSKLLDAAIAQGHTFDILAKPIHPTFCSSKCAPNCRHPKGSNKPPTDALRRMLNTVTASS